MNKRWLAGLLIGLACGAGAQTQKSAPLPTIYVDVTDGRIAVTPAGMKTPATQTTLTWWLRTSGYRFASGGVDFGDASSFFTCSLVNSGQGMRCTKSDQAPSGELPYSIRLQGSGEIIGSDPGILIYNE